MAVVTPSGDADGGARLNGGMPPITPDPVLAARLRADLKAAAYTADAVRAGWGPTADVAVGQGLRAPAIHALRHRRDSAAVLARLLFLGLAQAVEEVDGALPSCGAAGLVALGLATTDGVTVTPTALVRPQDADAGAPGGTAPQAAHWWIASDLDEAALGGALPTDHVLGVGGASLTLAGLQLSAPVDRALDIGSGCGIQSLRALLSADRVVATDVSHRALAYTRLNALLAGSDDVEVRHGSLFAPVAGELFDRVVSNPPFVITPRVAGVPEYEYRDAGFSGDDLVAAFITGVGDVLAPGGTAQLLGNWEYREGEDGLARVRAWVDASAVPLDAWIVERERLDPLSYAQLWVRDGGTVAGTPEYEALIEAWLTDFAERGVSAVGFGYVLLRRPVAGAPSLARYEQQSQPVPGALGGHLGDALAAWDALAELDDAALAAAVLRVAPDVTEARHHRPGEEAPTVIELRQGAGFARTIVVDPGLAALVGACDGDLPVGVLIAAIADLLEVDGDALASDLLPRVRELVFTGFLTFV